ncbi:MAG: hypothetical protein MUP76_01415 [Acidimicrobiia bacterium]|nr:hypothetical protein [Acidimicrobiia bacterium]
MSSDRMDSDAAERSTRSEIGEVLDRIAQTPPDALAERAGLRDRLDELRRALRQIEVPGAGEIQERWSVAATRHKVDDEDPTESIVSSNEGGGGGI